MKLSKKARAVIENINGVALEYFATLAGNEDLLRDTREFENYEKVSITLGCNEEYHQFYSLYSAATARSMDEAKEIFDDFYYFILEKICFPDGIH